MNLEGKVAIVTGAASGIGRALCRRFAAENPEAVVLSDVNAQGARDAAAEIGATPIPADVSRESDIQQLVELTVERYGRIDLFCSNAGVFEEGGFDVSDADWQRAWDINVRAHIYAARAVVPRMLERKQGYLLNVASAAGLLTQIGSAPYAVTKHAAVAFAEWLAVTYGDAGIKVSCLCPQGVMTPMLQDAGDQVSNFLVQTAITPEKCADAVIDGLADERFLILPHPEVAEYFRRKASDYDRWLRGMRKLRSKILS